MVSIIFITRGHTVTKMAKHAEAKRQGNNNHGGGRGTLHSRVAWQL